MNRYFTKENIQMTIKRMKIYSTSLAIRKMQIKAMMKFPYTPTRRAKIKIMTISNAGEDSEKLDLSCTGGRNVKWHCHSEK